jgi:hypothetical protein
LNYPRAPAKRELQRSANAGLRHSNCQTNFQKPCTPRRQPREMLYRQSRSANFARSHRLVSSRTDRGSWDRSGRVRTSNHPRKDPSPYEWRSVEPALAPKNVQDERPYIQRRRMALGRQFLPQSSRQGLPERDTRRRFRHAVRREHAPGRNGAIHGRARSVSPERNLFSDTRGSHQSQSTT